MDELRRIDAIAARRGFLELRGAITAPTEQLETNTYEVAVFGRVSSGKSSLLDAALGLRIVRAPRKNTPRIALASSFALLSVPSSAQSASSNPPA